MKGHIRKKILFLSLFFFTRVVVSLEYQPWFSELYNLHLLSSYSYSYYSSVDGASIPLSSTSKDHFILFDVEYTPSTNWNINADINFLDTPRQKRMNFMSSAFHLRYLWLDDIIGDPVSFVMGAHIRYVSKDAIRDISCPYHGRVEGEGDISIGKEIDSSIWRFRLWGWGGVGIANKGSPWLHARVVLEACYNIIHKFAFFFDTLHSYGRKKTVNIEKFYGYGSIRQKSLDLTARYGYKLGRIGTFRVEYSYKISAKRCPKNVKTFTLAYLLPINF